jgi:peptidoglycan hydrolase-like protein with peptidoglycan-binding domain
MLGERPDRDRVPAATEPALSPVRRRKRLVITVASLCVLSSAIGGVASRFVLSPAERAARTAPPSTTLLTAPVVLRTLNTTITVRGEVTPEAMVTVGGGGRPNPVVSYLPVRAGQLVRSGQLVAEISGQPIVALNGHLPAYRDLRVGDTGRDVRQLQVSLAALRLLSGSGVTGVVDAATAGGVRRLFSQLGYPTGAGVAGVVLPSSAVVYLPASPARVLSVTGAVGQTAPDVLVTVACGGLSVTSRVAPDQASLVRTGMKVDLLSEAIGKSTTGIVSQVGALITPSTTNIATPGQSTDPYVPIIVTTASPLGPEWSGQDIRVSLTSAKTSGPVLLVPVSAISAGADGRTSVTLRRGAESVVVPVTVGASGDGFVQIDGHGRVKAGDAVVVGT